MPPPTQKPPLGPTTVGKPLAPEILIPKRLDPGKAIALTPPGAVTPWGNERSTYRIAVDDPRGWAELAADVGLIRYKGEDLYEDLEGNPIQPDEVLPRFEQELRQKAGPRTIESKHRILTPFAGQVPETMQDMRRFMGLIKENVEGTGYARSYPMIKDAAQSVLYLIFAGARSLLNTGCQLEEEYGEDPRQLGYATGHGLPGADKFVKLVEATLEGRSRAGGMLLPGILQSAGGGTWTAIIGPKGDEIPDEFDAGEGVRAMGRIMHGSAECATFFLMMCLASDQFREAHDGEIQTLAMQVGASEAAFGFTHARLHAVGFNSVAAMETSDRLLSRGGGKDLWHEYAPFTSPDNFFWPSEGSGFTTQKSLAEGVAQGGPLDGILAGSAIMADQGGKPNPAQLGKGLLNAICQSLKMALLGHGVTPGMIDYISFHGTATPDTNAKEPPYVVKALEAMERWMKKRGYQFESFKRRERRIKATALKGLLQHLLSAAGGAENSILLQALRHQKAPGLFNIDGREISVPDWVQEWIEFSSDRLEGEGRIRAVLALSEGFWGNSAAMVVLPVNEETLERYGYSPQEIRIYQERVQERLALAREWDEMIRTGKKTYAEFLDWVSFRERPGRRLPSTAIRFTPPLQKEDTISPESEKIMDQFRRFYFTTDRWVMRPIQQIREALTQADPNAFLQEIEVLDDLQARLLEGDPSTLFTASGLRGTLRTIARNSKAASVLNNSPEVLQAIESFVSPEKIKPSETPKIATDAKIPVAAMKVVVGFPGQGSFEAKKTEGAQKLYQENPQYRAVVDESHQRLWEKYGYDLKAMLFRGSDEDFIKTMHQQPVLVTDEIARFEATQERLRSEGIHKITAAYGDSVGLIPASYAAGYFSGAADAVEFAYLRAQVMANLNPFGPTARPMEIVSNFPEEIVREIVRDVNDLFRVHVTVSKRNGVNKLVLTGDPLALQVANQRIIALEGSPKEIPVSTPFHDAHFFKDAAGELLDLARKAGLVSARRERSADLIANSTGQALSDNIDIIEFLAGEIAAPVDLVTSMQSAASQGGNVFMEIGPKSTLTNDVGSALGTMSQPPEGVLAVFVSKPEDLDKVVPREVEEDMTKED